MTLVTGQDGAFGDAVVGSLLFGIVPIVLSILGFLGANPALKITLPKGVDVSMIGVQTIAQLLPPWAVKSTLHQGWQIPLYNDTIHFDYEGSHIGWLGGADTLIQSKG